MNEKVVTVKNLQVTLDVAGQPLYATRGIDFDLYQGETLAIVGESGSGKSIAMHALMGLLPEKSQVSADYLQVFDRDILSLSKKELQQVRGRQIGLISQDALSALNPTMRVGKQILEAAIAHQHINKSDAKKKVYEQLSAVGIAEPKIAYRKYPHEFSGGQLQRIVIAMALISRPDILIADEPTTALDVTTQANILKLLRQQQKELNLSVIFITHNLAVAANLADRVAVMYAGKIIEIGKTREIFYSPQHPYTWGLLEAVPENKVGNDQLFTLPGNPPDLRFPPKGDAFAARNPYALAIDFNQEPTFFKVSSTHFAKTWLLDNRSPAYEPPVEIKERWQQFEQMTEGRKFYD